MQCPKCGKPIEGDGRLCQECMLAEQMAQQTAPETPAQEVPAEAPVAEKPAEEVPAAEEPKEETPAEEQPPKRKKTKLAILLGAVALVLVLALIFSWSSLEGMIAYAKSPEDYLVYVERKAMAKGSALDITGDLYGNFRKSLSEKRANSLDIAVFLTFGQKLTGTLEALTGGNLEMDWLRQISLHNTINNAGVNKGFNMTLGINGTPVLSADAILDTENYNAYIQAPQLNEKYVTAGVEDLGIDKQTLRDAITKSRELMAKLAEMLPDEEVFEALVRKYTNLALSKLENVERTKETVTINGLRQKFTVLQTDVSEQLAKDITLAILTEARSDRELLAFINSVQLMTQTEETTDEALMTYEEYTALLDEEIADLQAETADSGDVLVIRTYVDKHHNICGRSITEPDEAYTVTSLTVTQNNSWASEVKAGDDLLLSGIGTRNGTLFAGTYTFGKQDAMVTLEVENFELLAFNKGKLLGTFRLRPNQKMLESLAESMDMPAIADAAGLMLEFKTTGQTADAALYTGEELFLSVGVTATTKNLEALNRPANSVNISDASGMNQWVEEVNLDNLVEALKAAGVPEEYLALLQG